MPPGLIAIAAECGYHMVLSSRPGLIPVAGTGASDLPRMSVTAKTNLATLQKWLQQDRAAILRERARYGVLKFAKRAVGNARYERLRAMALRGSGQAA